MAFITDTRTYNFNITFGASTSSTDVIGLQISKNNGLWQGPTQNLDNYQKQILNWPLENLTGLQLREDFVIETTDAVKFRVINLEQGTSCEGSFSDPVEPVLQS